MAGALGPARHEPHRPLGRQSVLHADDVPIPVGRRAARGKPVRVHGQRHSRPLPADARPHGVRAARIRRIRHPLGELRAQGGRAPVGADSAQHRQFPAPTPPGRPDGGLAVRAVHHRRVVLQVDAVAVPAALPARAGIQEAGRGELVPVRQDRAGQRAGGERRVRALRHAGGAAVPRTVVLPHHRLRRAVARQSRRPRLVGEHQDGAAQLDRKVGGRRAGVPGAGPDGVRRERDGERRRALRRGDLDAGGHPRVHDPRRHDLRRDVPGGGPRTSAAGATDHRRAARRGRMPTVPPRPGRTSSRAR